LALKFNIGWQNFNDFPKESTAGKFRLLPSRLREVIIKDTQIGV